MMKKTMQFQFAMLFAAMILVSFVGCKSNRSDDDVNPNGGNNNGGGTPPPRASTVMVNGYLPNWKYTSSGYTAFDYTNLTIAFYAFVDCNVSGDVLTGGTTNENKMSAMVSAAHTAGTKAYLSFGGGAINYGSQVYYDMARVETSRREFARQVKELCLSKGFDGFDVDWEGLRNTQDGNAHELLMRTLKDTLDNAGLGLIITVQQGSSATFFTQTAVNCADLVQIMAYDATGSWNASPYGPHSSYEFAQAGISYWVNRGISASKLVLGVPFYGYQFNSNNTCPCNAVTYGQIASSYPNLSDSEDFIATGIYANTFFNGFQTISDKASLAHSLSMPGVMIWEMSQDATGSKSLLTKLVDYLALNRLTVKKLTSPNP